MIELEDGFEILGIKFKKQRPIGFCKYIYVPEKIIFHFDGYKYFLINYAIKENKLIMLKPLPSQYNLDNLKYYDELDELPRKDLLMEYLVLDETRLVTEDKIKKMLILL